MATVPGLQEFSEKALEKIDARWKKNFANDGVILQRFFNPFDSQALWTPEKRKEAVEILLAHAPVGTDFVEEVGKYVLREGYFAMRPEVKDTKGYWRSMALDSPDLAKFVIGVMSISPTEASVERAFSHRKKIHSDIRNSLSEESVEALMFVRMNAKLLGVCAH
jgi:hypothetical protein